MAVQFATTPAEHLSSSCLRFEARRVVLEFGHEHLSWPPADDVGDELYDAAEALAGRVIAKAIEALPAEGWQSMETAPMDGTPLILFARCKLATAPAPVIGWYHPELGWIECCFVPNRPVGLVPSAWMPRPAFPGELDAGLHPGS